MGTQSENIYTQLNDLRRQSAWQSWPKEVRSVLPEMARQRSAAMESVWFPSVVYIEPTNVCNANCIFCPRHNMTRPTGYMGLEFYEKLITQIASLGPSEIRLFHYGEPMLHKQLPDMVQIARDNGLPARFQTNGLRIEPDMVQRLLDAGLRYIGVSVNGLTRHDYEAIRPGLSFDQLTTNLTLLRTLVDQSGHACHIHLNAHAGKDEIAEREKDIQTFKTQWFHIADSLSVSGIRLYQGVQTLKNGHVMDTEQACNSESPAVLNCTEPFDRLIIKWDGRVSPCCVDFDGDMIIGDATKQSLSEIWESPTLKQLQDDLRTGNSADWPLCAKCPKRFSKTYNQLFIRNIYTTDQGQNGTVDMV